jgi:hypothetical protein
VSAARPRPLALGVLLTVPALLGVAAGCGISSDSSPRALDVSTTTTEPVASPTSGLAAAVVYYLADDRLVPVSRSIPDQEIGTVLNALLEPPDDLDIGDAITTSIPTGTELRRLESSGDTLLVDLSGDVENLAGPARQQAIGQIVMTATEFPDVARVRFSIDGQPIQVTSPARGDVDVVDRCDFASLILSSETARAEGLSQETITRLDQLATDLDRRCTATTTTVP